MIMGLGMQPNYPYPVNDRAGYAPMWYAPNVENTAWDTDVPPIYAPYPLYAYWPPSLSLSGLGDSVAGPLPAPTPAAAASPDQALAPISLVSPLPAIVQPQGTVASDQVPNPSPSISCSLTNWINANPMLAAVSAVGLFLIFSSGGSR